MTIWSACWLNSSKKLPSLGNSLPKNVASPVQECEVVMTAMCRIVEFYPAVPFVPGFGLEPSSVRSAKAWGKPESVRESKAALQTEGNLCICLTQEVSRMPAGSGSAAQRDLPAGGSYARKRPLAEPLNLWVSWYRADRLWLMFCNHERTRRQRDPAPSTARAQACVCFAQCRPAGRMDHS